MATYIILSKIAHNAVKDPGEYRKLSEAVTSRLKEECPQVQWKHGYATLGRYDSIDIVETDDPKQLEKAVLIIRAYGHSKTETLPATEWSEFLANL